MSRMLDALRRIEAKTAALAEQPDAQTSAPPSSTPGASGREHSDQPLRSVPESQSVEATHRAEATLDRVARSLAHLQAEERQTELAQLTPAETQDTPGEIQLSQAEHNQTEDHQAEDGPPESSRAEQGQAEQQRRAGPLAADVVGQDEPAESETPSTQAPPLQSPETRPGPVDARLHASLPEARTTELASRAAQNVRQPALDQTRAAVETPASDMFGPLQQACGELAERILAGLPVPGAGSVLLVDAACSEARVELLVGLLPALARSAGTELVVVDADFRRAELTARLGVLAVRGTAQALLPACAWQEALRPTALAGVSLLPGVASPAVPEERLLKSYRWERLLADLQRRFRLVVVDGGSWPDVQEVPGASCCDSTYLLVTLGHTAYGRAAQAAAALRRQGARLSGCIAVGQSAEKATG